ncbi:MAG: DUF308 domain-containing protein [Propionibacteriaceae bacterium]|nr:DUF308 domain-containing protein [Propionibacteriaceae bacterium]
MSATSFDDQLKDMDRKAVGMVRGALGVAGLIALIMGVVILAWPAKSASVVAGFVAVYALIAGVVAIAIGIFSRRRRGWARVGHLALGAVFLVTAILAFANLGTARDVLAVLIGVVVGFTWLVEGVVALALIADAPSKVWTVVYSVITIVAGAVLITSPLWGAAILWLLLGISLVVSGIVQLVRAFRFGSKAA